MLVFQRKSYCNLWTRSSGKTTLAIQGIVEAQKMGGIAAIIDRTCFDQFYAKIFRCRY